MNIFITGIHGFLGGALADELTRAGHSVVGNDNHLCSTDAPDFGGDILNIDCCDFNAMRDAISAHKTDVLIHCAATAHEGLSNFSPSFITKNIYEASVSTFSAAIASGVRRIIFMSSMARYGRGIAWCDYVTIGNDPMFASKPPFREDFHLPRPVDPYGIAKVAAEETLKSLCKLHGVEYVILVPHNIIGPRQRYNDPYRNVASIMINRALQGKPILVYGDGQQKRCFSPISDCLDSLIKAIDAPISGEIINIGPDDGKITVLELAGMIKDLTGGMAEIQHLPARPNEVKNAYCSSDKARRLLGYGPKQNLHDCLAEMVLYIKAHGVKEFNYSFSIEIEKGCPAAWKDRLI